MIAAPPALKLDAVTKDYGPVRALVGLSLTVEAGEVFGLLGHNGAGKTTAVRILTGRTRADSGSCHRPRA